MSKLGERLKKAREHAGLTQPQLEALTGIKQATISKIELGKNKTEETAFGVHLAVACGVRPEWLVLDIGPMINEIKADEIQLLEKYRDADDSGRTAILRVAESLALPYTKTSTEVAHSTEVTQVTPNADQISQNAIRHPDAHLHIKTYTAGRPETGQKKATGGKPVAGE